MEDSDHRIAIPPRSGLFGLAPIGIGSSESEGLISYLVRLAKAHSISPRLLMNEEFLPRMREVNSVHHGMFFKDYARTLQSTGKFADKFVAMTEELTCRDDIVLLTALPWREIVPSIGTGLTSLHPKWCRACLAEDRCNHTPIYFRLSWGYALYQVCAKHQEQLINECPWCGAHQPFIPIRANIDRCNYCNGWLGTMESLPDKIDDPYQDWISDAIEDMIINGAIAMRKVTGESFRDRLTQLVAALADGQKTQFSEMLGFTRSTMASWITKKQKPLFPQLLCLCHRLGMLPSELLLGDFIPDKAEIPYQPHTEKLHQISPRIGLQEPPKHEIWLKLSGICNDPKDCRPLTDITVELGLTRKYLIYWFKKECELISLKHKQWINKTASRKKKEQISHVRNMTWWLHDQGIYPSNRRVAKLISPSKLCFAKSHLRNTHRKTLKELGVN
jgi:hypothetical protein